MGSRFIPFFPEQASTHAGQVDALYLFELAVSAFFSILIAALIVTFAIRYRRRSPSEQPAAILGSLALELTWTIIPFGIVMVMFGWGTHLFFSMSRVPPDAMEVYVVGKRWMWKVQHMTGQREINELHVPIGVPVKLTLASEDVIHSFFVPAFRVKKDVVPGRYNTIWFEATRPGRYHLFCAEYCGTRHSGMVGSVVAMEPAAFQTWLSGGAGDETPVVAGQRLFQELGCVTCHRADSGARGPRLDGLFGSPVRLSDGQTVTADESYVRESILSPAARIVAGYQPIMPTYQGLVSEEAVMQLVAYVQSLGPADSGGAPADPLREAEPGLAASPAPLVSARPGQEAQR